MRFLALLFILSSCSTLSPDMQALVDENASLRQQLEECEADAEACLSHLTECYEQ